MSAADCIALASVKRMLGSRASDAQMAVFNSSWNNNCASMFGAYNDAFTYNGDGSVTRPAVVALPDTNTNTGIQPNTGGTVSTITVPPPLPPPAKEPSLDEVRTSCLSIADKLRALGGGLYSDSHAAAIAMQPWASNCQRFYGPFMPQVDYSKVNIGDVTQTHVPPVVITPDNCAPFDLDFVHAFNADGTYDRSKADAAKKKLQQYGCTIPKNPQAPECATLSPQYIAAFSPDGSYDRKLADDIKKQLKDHHCYVPANPYPHQVNPCTGLNEDGFEQSTEELLLGQPIAKIESHPLVAAVSAIGGGIATRMVGMAFAPELMAFKPVAYGTLAAGVYAGIVVNGMVWGAVDDVIPNGVFSPSGILHLVTRGYTFIRDGEKWVFSFPAGKKMGSFVSKVMAGPMTIVPDVIDIFAYGTLTKKGYDKEKCIMKCDQKSGISRAACKAGARLDLEFL